MGKHAQIVIGAAGAGKSTYCYNMMTHMNTAMKRTVHVINLDPAAEHFEYTPSVDIRTLLTVEEVMKEHQLGPNGGLMFCLEVLLSNLAWLEEAIGDYDEDYLLFDCPGQIELYSHQPLMRNFVRVLQQRFQYRVCVVYLIDSHFITEPSKLMSGALACLSAMMLLEATHLNVLTKVDLLEPKDKELLEARLQFDPQYLLADLTHAMSPRFAALNAAFASLLSDFDLVSFCPLDPTDPDSLSLILQQIDHATQYYDDAETQIPHDLDEE